MNKHTVFLVATIKDSNSHILFFSLVLVLRENYAKWNWFVQHMECTAQHFHAAFSPAFVSDRQKGLIMAVSDNFTGCWHRFCLRHIINDIAKLGPVLEPREESPVFVMARSECENEFDFHRDVFAEIVRRRPATWTVLGRSIGSPTCFKKRGAAPRTAR